MPACGTLTIEAPFDAAKVSIVGCSNPPREVEAGTTVDLAMTLKNTNDKDATLSVRWVASELADSPVLAEASGVTVPAGQTKTITRALDTEKLGIPLPWSSKIKPEKIPGSVAPASG